jgi:hypothetical protein
VEEEEGLFNAKSEEEPPQDKCLLQDILWDHYSNRITC